MFKKSKKYCNLCNIQIGKLDKIFCRDCKKVRDFIRDNGMIKMLEFITKFPLHLNPPSAPPLPPQHSFLYPQVEPNK